MSPAWRESWSTALLLVGITRAVFALVAWTGAVVLGDERDFFSLWDRWDAGHFLAIAEHGYTGEQTDEHATAMFPLYPLVVRVVAWSGLSLVQAGMLVALVASVVACAYLHRLAEEEFGAGAGSRAVLYLLLFPTAVFLAAPYSEALFLAGAIPAFYYARQGRWSAVALPAAVATGTRFAGVFVLLGLAVEALLRGPRQRVATAGAALGLGALPLGFYLVYLAQVFGAPLHFVTSQRAGWHRQLTAPLDALRATLQGGWGYPWGVEVAAAVVGAAVVAWALARREWGYATYMGATLAVLLVSTWYYSVPRVLLGFFPAVLLLAEVTGRRGHELVLVVLAPLATVGVLVFTRGAWFF